MPTHPCAQRDALSDDEMKKIAALQQQRAEQQQQAAAAQMPSSSNILQVRQEHCSSVQLHTPLWRCAPFYVSTAVTGCHDGTVVLQSAFHYHQLCIPIH